MQINPNYAAFIIKQANFFVRLVNRIPDFPKGTDSGYCVVKYLDGRLLLAFQVGRCPEAEKYLRFANEKVDRLRAYSDLGHLSSWQSRCAELRHYSGAILAGNIVFSFSGLPEEADEAVMIHTALTTHFLSPETAREIVKISNNKTFHAISKTLKEI